MRAFQRDLERDGRRGRVVAHRGARAYAPENTLPAFAKAFELGCDMIELDVHRSRDGVVVVHHDDDLRRCTNAAEVFPDRTSYAIAAFSHAELKTLDAGSWFARELQRPASSRESYLRSLTPDERASFMSTAEAASFASGSIRVPMLHDVLSLARRAGSSVNIELKPTRVDDPGLAEATWAAISAAGMVERVLVSSFDAAQLRLVRSISDLVATGLLTDASVSSSTVDPISVLREIDADALNPNVHADGCIDDLRAVIAAGRMAFPWTCNDPDVFLAMVDAGATGVITDYPNRMRPTRATTR